MLHFFLCIHIQISSQRANKPSSMLLRLGCGDGARALESKLCMARSGRLSWPIDHAHVLSKEPQTLTVCTQSVYVAIQVPSGRKKLQSRWSKDLCFKRFVQIPQSTYPTSGRTPICHQISKSIPTSPVRSVRNTLKYVFNLLHTYFILCYTVLIKAFVSLCVTKSVASRPCDARDCTGKKRWKGEKAQTNGFERILHKLHGFHGESRFLSYGGTMRHNHFCSFCGNGEKKASLTQLWNGSRVPLFQGAVSVFRADKKRRTSPRPRDWNPVTAIGN